METLLGLPALVALALVGSSSIKITSGGRSRLMERLGRCDRELSPGLSVVLPMVERVVSHESLKERVLDISPQQCITRDNVSDRSRRRGVLAVAGAFTRLLRGGQPSSCDGQSGAYSIRAEMGKLDLDQTFITRNEASEVLLRELDQATDSWGVKDTRVEMRDIVPSAGVQQAMEQQMKAEREQRAAALRSEGKLETHPRKPRKQCD